MNARLLHQSLSLGFAALLCSVPAIQSLVELSRGQWPQALELFERPPAVAHLRAFEQRLQDASVVAQRLRPWMQLAQFVLLRDGGEKALVGREGWLFYRPGVQYLTQRPDAAKGACTAQEAASAMVDFRDQLAARGIHLLVVPVPNKESIYPEKASRRADRQARAGLGSTALSRAPAAPSDSRPPTRGHAPPGGPGVETGQLLQRLRSAGVETVDLFEVFTRAKADASSGGSGLYLAQDTHWSGAGVALAARAVAERLRALGWASNGSMAYELRPAEVRRVGDLIRILQVPALERLTVPETVACAQVVRAGTGEPYQDDPAAAVLVLGDSFLRIYQKDDPEAAGFMAHLARELKQPVASLVHDGGASTLVRQALHRQPELLKNKRVVVWEFAERDIRLGMEGWQRVPLPPPDGASQP